MQFKQSQASSSVHAGSGIKSIHNRPRPEAITQFLLRASQMAVVIVAVVLLSLTSYVLALAGSIAGQVTDADGQPLAGINVALYELNEAGFWQGVYDTTSNEGGNYTLDDLAAGTYRMGFAGLAYPAPYQEEFYDDEISIDGAVDIVLSEDQAVSNMNAQLTKLAEISGRVTDESGVPLPDIYIELYTMFDDPCCPDQWYALNGTLTDVNGNYTIATPKDDTYRIGFFDYNVTLYQSEYYDNVSDLAGATDIVVTGGQDVTGIDAQLTQFSTISGRVNDESGSPLSSIEVTLYQQSTDLCCLGEWHSIRSTDTDGGGNYSLGEVVPGIYRIGFLDNGPSTYQAEYYDNVPDLESATNIVVSDGQNVDGINAQLSTPDSVERTDLLYISSSTGGTVGDLRFADEDIIVYDPNSGMWARYFDGSDVGLRRGGAKDVDAFAILPDGSLLFSFVGRTTIPDVGAIDDSDIIRFIPTALGMETTGNFEMYLDGSDVGLTKNGEDISAIDVLVNGDIVISTKGTARVKDASGQTVGNRDEDLFLFKPQTLGDNTTGFFQRYYLDGSDVGLDTTSKEDIRAVSVDEETSHIYLTTRGDFGVGKMTGDGVDVFVCESATTGVSSACGDFSLFFDGSESAFSGRKIDAVHVEFNVPTLDVVNASSQSLDDDEVVDATEDEFDVEGEDDGDEELVPSIYLPVLQ
ncbi:MAG: carboxypeptidase regulatory-like domain-containing protein [Chloroflexota bacterium]